LSSCALCGRMPEGRSPSSRPSRGAL
jgi:hypothetical protein